ncbi:MAG: multidrug effflux MFS transporter [Aureispira sp.]|nr:multidrug effflux MFS transporter [Aureispira sp.]
MNQLKSIPFLEFVALMATMMALTALSIDAVLPALATIGNDLGQLYKNNNQLIISSFFLGLALGQFVYGALSDSWGRKSPIYLGMSIFVLGSIMSIFANSFGLLIASRFLQGIGLASPRTVGMAIIRDRYKGSEMARVMSFVMMVFILVPVLAPSLGQGLLSFMNWRSIFIVILGIGMLVLFWFYQRMEETLKIEQRVPFSVQQLKKAILEIYKTPRAFYYTITSGLISGAFIGFLNSSQQVFQEQYQLKEQFPLYFAALASSLGAAAFLNSKLVLKYGMVRMVKIAVVMLVLIACTTWGIFNLNPQATIHLWQVMTYLVLTLFFTGILFGNLSSLAMEPLGKIAGTGASIIGAFSTLIGASTGTLTGLRYNGTIIPMIEGFIIMGSLSLVIIYHTERK